MSQYDKLGGRLVINSATCNFGSFVNQIGLIDLGFAGNPFTWCNNRHGFATIKERLDRGLDSQSWIQLHPNYSLLHTFAYNYDHNPISLNSNNHSFYLPRPFRFEEFWNNNLSCGKVCVWQSLHLPPQKTQTH
jgi:hypothetical protein